MAEPTEKKKPNRKREIFIRFMVTEPERDMIYKRMEQAGVKNLRAYLLKMAIDGQVVRIELDSVKEMTRLLGNATNNINQIARRVNSGSPRNGVSWGDSQGGDFYDADLDEIKARVDEIWAQTKVVMRKIAAM